MQALINTLYSSHFGNAPDLWWIENGMAEFAPYTELDDANTR